jgi:hypothetical protein
MFMVVAIQPCFMVPSNPQSAIGKVSGELIQAFKAKAVPVGLACSSGVIGSMSLLRYQQKLYLSKLW